MLMYLEEIDQAINTDEISRIYQYKIPTIDAERNIAIQLEEGVSPTDLAIPDPQYNTTILLKDGVKLNIKSKVKEIIEEIRKHA